MTWPVLVLGDEDVSALLDLGSVVERLETAFRAADAGLVTAFGRYLHGPHRDVVVMGGSDSRWAVVKSFLAAALSPPAAVVYDLKNREMSALVVSSVLSRLRTCGVSALASRLLVSPDTVTLGMVGAGRQAHGHVDALVPMLGIEHVRVYSRDPAHAAALVQHVRKRHGIHARVTASVESAVDGVGIVCLTTKSSEPLVHARHLRSPVCVIAVGANRRGRRELASDVVANAFVVVDDVRGAREEADELRVPVAEGLLGWHNVVSLGSLIRGVAERRPPEAGVSIFKNLGWGIADVAVMGLLVERAVDDRNGLAGRRNAHPPV